jgi:hypothetical protein
LQLLAHLKRDSLLALLKSGIDEITALEIQAKHWEGEIIKLKSKQEKEDNVL